MFADVMSVHNRNMKHARTIELANLTSYVIIDLEMPLNPLQVSFMMYNCLLEPSEVQMLQTRKKEDNFESTYLVVAMFVSSCVFI